MTDRKKLFNDGTKVMRPAHKGMDRPSRHEGKVATQRIRRAYLSFWEELDKWPSQKKASL